MYRVTEEISVVRALYLSQRQKYLKKQTDTGSVTRVANSDAASQLPETNSDAFPARLKTIVGSESARAFARRADVSDTFLRQCLAGKIEPTRPILVALAAAGDASVGWLATGEGQKHPHPGEAPQAPVTAPGVQAPQGFNEGLPPAYKAPNAAESGVKAAVSLAVAALGDQSQHIQPERLADLIDAAHQLLQSGADPALVRRLIVAVAGQNPPIPASNHA